MDFGSILHAAQENEYRAKHEHKKCYTTTFSAPKKEEKHNKTLSVNIQKFLRRREEEEKRKEEEAKKKRDELLALRSQDGKAKKRVSAMLKRTKAANKSVIEDAIDEDNTAVTLSGPSQPDEDDYGYVSQEASAYYNKLMDKYSAAPVEEPLYSAKKKKVHRDLNSTKDRVRMALQKEEEEEMMPHKRRRRVKAKKEDDPGDTTLDYRSSDLTDLGHRESDNEEEVAKETVKPKVKRPSAPPPINFQELLKLAEKKQFEPVKIEPKKKPEDEDHRPMTKKQKVEYRKEQEWRQRKEEATRTGQAHPSSASQTLKIPKISNKEDSSQRSSTSDRGQDRPSVPLQQMKIPKKPSVNREEERPAGGYRREERPPNSVRKSDSVGAPPPKIPRTNGSLNRENNNSAPLKTNSTNKDDRMVKKIPKESDDVMRRQRTDSGSISVRKSQIYEDGERSKGNRNDHTNASSNDSRRLPPKTPEGKPNPELILKHLQESGYDKKLQEAIMAKMMEYEKEKRTEESTRGKPSGKPPGKDSVSKLSREAERSGTVTKTQGTIPSKSERPMASQKPSSAGNSRQQELTPQNRPSAVPLSKPKVLPPEGKSKAVPSTSKPLSAGDVRTKPTPQPSAQGKATVASDSRKMPPPKQLPPGARPRNLPPPETRPKQFPPPDMKPKQFPPADMRPKQFPPPDMRRKPKQPLKRRITDSEDEYDPEMDDFIDDGPGEEEDYSKHIREIFGYDRRKYSRIGNDNEDDDECMESNFATILKEDFISTKTGILEDLEDIRREKEMERRKKLSKMKKK